jgi:TonB family protein
MIRLLLVLAMPAVFSDNIPRFVLPPDVAGHVGKTVIVCGMSGARADIAARRVAFTIESYRAHRPGSVLISVSSQGDQDARKYVGRPVCATGTAKGKEKTVYVDVASADHIVDDPLMKDVVTGADVEPAKVLRRVLPRYTLQEMKRARGRGSIGVDVVVLPNGVAGETRVVRSLEPALEARAVAALKLWEFAPAMRDGAPVTSLSYVEFNFAVK